MGLGLQAPRRGTGLLCSVGEDDTDEMRSEVRLSAGHCHGDGAEASVCDLARLQASFSLQAVCTGGVQQGPTAS